MTKKQIIIVVIVSIVFIILTILSVSGLFEISYRIEHDPYLESMMIKKEIDREMLKFVIMCESSGNMDAVGAQGELGILQYKPKTWDFLSYVFEFEGSIDNKEDQIELFLLSYEEYGHYWTCYRKWEKLQIQNSN